MTLPQFGTPHVRCFDLDTAARLECLSPDERARADRFHFARDARRWAAGRALLRCTLSAYLSAAPEKLCFALGPWGKPFLPDCPLRFSVTHSDSALLVAIAWQQEVGIDIEGRRPGSTPEQLAPPLPPGEPRAGGAAHARLQGSGEFDGVRAYRRGDPLKLVVWKKAAKADELVSRDTEQAQRYELWLDFVQAGAGGTEHKLSRLTAWVLQADKQALDYGLRLPGQQLSPSSGEAHKRRCLEALATC